MPKPTETPLDVLLDAVKVVTEYDGAMSQYGHENLRQALATFEASEPDAYTCDVGPTHCLYPFSGGFGDPLPAHMNPLYAARPRRGE